jgi:peroxiredoxin Q/BCP
MRTEPSVGPRTRALVVADGTVPERAALDAAWPGWADGIDLVVAADGGARGARRLGLAINLWVGDGDSLDPGDLARLEAAGIPLERAPSDKDESDTELAVLAAVRLGADDLTLLGALGGPRVDHALANLALLAHPALAGRSVRLLDAGSRVILATAPGQDGGPVTIELPGRVGDLVSLLPFGTDVAGVTTRGLRYPLLGEDLRAGPARGLSNVRVAGDAAVELRSGRLLVVESPATLPPMSMPAVGDLAPEVDLPDDRGVVHRLADRRGRWTILYFYAKDDTPGCTVEACAFRDANDTIVERGADVWGVSPQGAASKQAFREKFGLPFTLLADEDHRVADAYGSWVEKQNYGKTYWGVARTTFLIDPDGRIARVWPRVRPEGHPDEVLAALDEAQASRGG